MKWRRKIEPQPLSKLLPGVLSVIRRQYGGTLAAVRAAWPGVVGAEVARRTRVAGIDQGILSVDVASSALKHDLSTFRREEILAALRKRLPGVLIRAIRYRAGRPS